MESYDKRVLSVYSIGYISSNSTQIAAEKLCDMA